MLIKLLTEAHKGRENSSAKRDKYGGQRPAGPRQLREEDGYLQLVVNICTGILICYFISKPV